MKKWITLALFAALLVAALCGCADTNRSGNVSTTDNGYVNGTNDGMYGTDAYDRTDTYRTDTYDRSITGNGTGGLNGRSYGSAATPYAR